jgi:Helix-turn-helix domain
MSSRELERVEVMGRVAKKSLKLVHAAEILRLSYRQVKRLWKIYQHAGAAGLKHGHAGSPSNRAKPEKFRGKVLRLVARKYSGSEEERFGPTLAAEHLAEEDGLLIDAETLRRWMLEEDLWMRQRKRKAFRKRRERKRHFGELVQLDGALVKKVVFEEVHFFSANSTMQSGGCAESEKRLELTRPVEAVELRAMRLKDEKRGDAMGQASWHLPFLGHPRAKCFSGNAGSVQKRRKWLTSCLQNWRRFPFRECQAGMVQLSYAAGYSAVSGRIKTIPCYAAVEGCLGRRLIRHPRRGAAERLKIAAG